jgi:hypothetical protein
VKLPLCSQLIKLADKISNWRDIKASTHADFDQCLRLNPLSARSLAPASLNPEASPPAAT